jgi:hypothetical protein
MSNTEYKPLSVGDWLITLIVLAIPVVNIVMLFVWAFSDTTHPSKQTYAKASLILAGIAVAIGILFVVMGVVLGGMTSSH